METLVAARGRPFDPTDATVVGAENEAYAVAIDQDGYGANERFANEMNPATSTVGGLLPRWERIFNAPPLPGDAQSTRQNRVAKALLRFTQANNSLGTNTVLANLFGSLFASLNLATPGQANTWWPGAFGSTAKITAAASNVYTIAALASVPTDAPGNTIVVSNANVSANNGTFPIKQWLSRTSVQYLNPTGGAVPDYGVGGSIGSPTVGWKLVNAARPFTSTVAHVLARLDPTVLPAYLNPDGTLSAAFFAVANQLNTALDLLMPADETFDWYVNSSHGSIGWYLDEPNLDVLAFDA